MANVGIYQGGGALIAGANWTLSVAKDLTPAAPSVGKIDVTLLSTTGAKLYIPEQVTEPNEIKVLVFDDPNNRPGIGSIGTYTAPYTITVTYGLIGTFTSATHAADAQAGYISKYAPSKLEINKAVMAEVTIQLSGNATHTNAQ